MFKVALFVCSQALLAPSIAGQLIGGAGLGGGAGCCGASLNTGCAPITTSGGGFIVTSSSPINPSGLYVLSENSIEGCLGVNGQIPFLGAVAVQGEMPANGNSAVCYKCGDCEIGITGENNYAAAAAAGPCCGAGLAGQGLGTGLGAPGLGGGLGGPGLCCGAGYGAGYGVGGYGGQGFGAGLGYGLGPAGY